MSRPLTGTPAGCRPRAPVLPAPGGSAVGAGRWVQAFSATAWTEGSEPE